MSSLVVLRAFRADAAVAAYVRRVAYACPSPSVQTSRCTTARRRPRAGCGRSGTAPQGGSRIIAAMPIPDDRCQRCTGLLDPTDTWMAYRDRVCGHCANTARKRNEVVTKVENDKSAPPA